MRFRFCRRDQSCLAN